MGERAKAQAAETTEAVKAKTQEVVDNVAEDVKKAKDAAAVKIDEIVEDTNEEVEELKAKADSKLQSMFNKKEDAPADVE
jgi:F0F1-type ATP synthase membrane subunit b/b'